MVLLQMDIEGDEWVVLKQVAQQPIIDLIGQVGDRLATQQSSGVYHIMQH